MLRKVATEHARLAEFLLFKEPSSYETLEGATTEYVRSCELFVSNFSFEESRPATTREAAEIMRNDVTEDERRLDNKLDTLAISKLYLDFTEA